MGDNKSPEPVERFTGLAEIYSQARPGYPREALDHIIKQAALTSGAAIADIGCGTGISSRLFAGSGFSVVGIEPNADMRLNAEKTEPRANLAYQAGTAEATGLPDGSVDLVLCAQAFHWFRADEALCEFQRILKPLAWVALMWNERNEQDPFTREFGDAMRLGSDTNQVEAHRAKAGEVILASKLFAQAHKKTFANAQELDAHTLVQRAFSASYAPKQEADATRLKEKLLEAFSQYNRGGNVQLQYQTSVYLAQKPVPKL